MFVRTALFTFAASTAAFASPAHAELPEAARQMIDTALASGDNTKIATVLDLARKTWPDDGEEIAAIESAWAKTKAEKAALAAKEKEEAIRTAGLLDRWTGQGELGGFHSTGNSDTTGITAALHLKRQGIDWSHHLRARFDYQRQNGVTSREKYFASYEPRWEFDEGIFAYGLAQYDRDAFQGIDGRYAVSGGLGYQVIDGNSLSLSLKAGPAYRVTDYTDGRVENRVAGLAGLDFDWRILDRVTLTQDANAVAETGGQAVVIVDSSNTTLNLVTGLDFKATEKLRARMSYAIDYDSNPAVGAVSTDTVTRASIVYDF
jgi:putative salt-induced outer membrane protein